MIDREQMDGWQEPDAPERIWACPVREGADSGFWDCINDGAEDATGYLRLDAHEAAIREAVEAERRNWHDVIQYLAEIGEIDQGLRELISEQLAVIRGDGA